MKHLLLALFLALPGIAQAVQVQVSWDLPTSRVDGTPLPASELAKTTVEWGTCGTDTIASVEGSVDVPAPGTTVAVERGPGEVCFRANVTDTENRTSAWSPTVMTTVPSDAPPENPVILQIAVLPLPQTEQYVAYSVKGYQNTVVRLFSDRGMVKAPGSNLVDVGSPCNCVAQAYLDADGLTWCGVEGQIQVANNTASGGVPRGAPFPAGYGATCRAVG